MSITVRLIFWGLIGFVPSPDGQEGMTALLVDPSRVQNLQTVCPIPQHHAVVYMLDGRCTGDCLHIPEDGFSDARDMGFQPTAGEPGRPEAVNGGGPLPLAWLLDREDLDISEDENARMKFRNPFLSFIRRVFPKSEWQAGYFSWVQSFDELMGKPGPVLEDCLQSAQVCPLHGRFKVQGGEASACHLFHGPEPSDSTDDKRDVKVFDYKISGKTVFQRAVADAVLVEYEARGGAVVLRSWDLDGKPGFDEPKAKAYLEPDPQGRLTLVVANFPPAGGPAEPAHLHSECGPHSDFLLRLLTDRPSSLAVRDETSKGIHRINPGSCEREATRLAEILGSAQEPPHSTTACDGGIIRSNKPGGS